MSDEQIHFVTDRLAASALRATLEQLAPRIGFQYTVDVLPITVAALMTPAWIRRHWQVPSTATQVLIPGYCTGDLRQLEELLDVPIRRGPSDLRQLPEFFGQPAREDYGDYDIDILAEINHSPRLTREELVDEATRLVASGADLIDIGCIPGERWRDVGENVRALRDLDIRVSIDSFDSREVADAARAGAELVLSVNRTNREAAADWGCEVVVIPDEIGSLNGLAETIDYLADAQVPLRIDPVLEPIGHGFTASLHRYMEVRRIYPDAEMMMGIGNLTELTDVDSAGVNVLLLGICQELGIRSVLTTQVINWARSSVQECDLGRRLVHYAVKQRVLPKHLEADLVMLRDPKLYAYGEQQMGHLAAQIKDHNYRLFAEQGRLHLLGGGFHLQAVDPFDLFQQLLEREPRNLDAAHAFYLGYELSKALTALQLGKQYEQDEALRWGFLTVDETSHRERVGRRKKSTPKEED